MKIKRVDIENFGKLKDYSLEFAEGMNFIYGNNEDGKTTMMSFIKMMFYGNVGAARDLTNLRKKYRPWDGSPMGGAIEFSEGGKDYRIQKRFGNSAARDEVSVYCLTTGETVRLNKDEEAGSHFFGMELDAFERSVFIGQTGGFSGKDGKTDEITARLTNLTTSADENVSVTAAMENLTAAAEKMVSRRGNAGILVENKEQLAQLNEELRTAKEIESAQREMREEYEHLLVLQKAEKERLSVLHQKRREEMNCLQEATQAEKNYQEMKNRLELLEMNHRNQKDLRMMQMKAEEDKLRQAEEASLEGKKEKSLPLCGITAVLFAVAAVLLMILLHPAFAVLLVPAGILFLAEVSTRKREARMEERRKSASRSADAVREKIEKMKKQLESEETEARHQRQRLYEETETAGKSMERKRRQYEEMKQLSQPEQRLEAEIMMRDEAITSLRNRIRTPEKSIQQIEAEVKELAETVAEQQQTYDALRLALRMMQEAAEELRQNFGPRLSKRTSEIFSKLTNGRYQNVVVSKDFGISVLESKDVYYRDGGYLSNGTVDQVYFSLRLAIAELLTKDGERHFPVLLDDIFEQYDERRTEDGLNFLADYTKDDREQVLFFTCHGQLAEMARGLGVPAAYLKIRK